MLKLQNIFYRKKQKLNISDMFYKINKKIKWFETLSLWEKRKFIVDYLKNIKS